MNEISHPLNYTSTNFNYYTSKLKTIPILSRQDEYILAKKFKDNNDLNAAKILIESHLKYVVKIAKKYTGYGLILSDLIQEGTIGLMKAVKRFEPERKLRLISFAIYWIKSEIHEYIIKNIRLVKIATTKSQKKLFFNIKKFKKIGWLQQKEIKSLSNMFHIKHKEIIHMEKRLNKKDIPFNTISYHENKINDINSSIPENYIKSNNKDPLFLLEQENWKKHTTNKLKQALYHLDKRSQEILKNRWLNEKKQTLKKLAQIYNISSERIRQLEDNAIQKLKNLITF